MASARQLRAIVKRIQHAAELTAAEQVRDHWTSGMIDAAPSPEQVMYGPVVSASGGGAEGMIRHYSNPAKQHGATLTVEQLSRDLDSVRVTMRSITSSLENLTDAVGGLVQHVGKSATNQDAWADGGSDEDDDEDDDEVGKSKARRLRALARAERRAARELAAAETARERRAAAQKAERAREATSALAAQQLDAALKGLGVLTASVNETMNFLMSRGRAGGVPPAMRKAAEPTGAILKASPAKRAEIAKSTSASIADRVRSGALPPGIEGEVRSFLQLLQSPVSPDPAFLRKFASRMTSAARSEISHLLG